MIHKLKHKLQTDIFLRRCAIYFAGSMAVAFFNYAFYPILGRLLPPADFGDVQALVSLIAQSAIIFSSFSIVAVHITANIEDRHERNAVISELQKIVFWIVGIVFVLLLSYIFKLESFFNFSSIYPLAGLSAVLLISAATTFRTAFLQGSGRFTELSLSGVISSLGRIVFAVGCIFLGLGVLGATLGIVLANIFMLIYLFYQTADSLHLGVKANMHTLEKGRIMKELMYGALVFFASGLVTFYYTSDVLIIKHYFDPVSAGLYSGISAVAKIIFFVIGPTSAVLFSSIKIRHSFAENAAVLRKSFVISLVLGGCGLIAFCAFGGGIISIMMGGRYVPFANFLPKAGLVMFLAAIANILTYYFLALRRFFIVIVSSASALFAWLILLRSHANIDAVLNGLLASIVLTLALLTIAYAKDYFNYYSGLQ